MKWAPCVVATPCRAHLRLQVQIVPQAGSMLPEFPATPRKGTTLAVFCVGPPRSSLTPIASLFFNELMTQDTSQMSLVAALPLEK
jgi:hypothetical protein